MKYKILKKIRNQLNRIISPKSFLQPAFKSNDFGFSRGTPIDRYYIDQFLNYCTKYFNGKVLEFGDSLYFDKFKPNKSSTCDIFTSKFDKRNDGICRIQGDLCDINSNLFYKYDCIICTNVLNFIFNTTAAISGISKMLKPGGICIVTLAGFSTQISRFDYERWGDYWRFSDQSAIRLFENDFDIILLKNYGNVYSSIAQMSGFCVEELDIERVNKIENDYIMITGIILKKK